MEVEGFELGGWGLGGLNWVGGVGGFELGGWGFGGLNWKE